MLRMINDEQNYEAALERVYNLMQIDIVESSLEWNELHILSLLVEQYEKTHYHIAPPHPIEAIKFRMEQLGMKESDLKTILGTRVRQSDIFSGKRKLSLTMIRALHERLNIPAESLIAAY